MAAVDWLRLGTLLPICLFGLVMTVVHGVRGDFVRLPWPHNGWLESAANTESYPIVRRVDSSATGFLILGEDRPGALADNLERLADRNINVAAVEGLAAGAGRWGAIVWVDETDVQRAGRALRARARP